MRRPPAGQWGEGMSSQTIDRQQASRRRSPKLLALLVIRGTARFLIAFYVAWSLSGWFGISVWAGVVFALLTWNYLFTYVVGWFSPAVLGGPLRVRPWQSFVLFANALVFPVAEYAVHGRIPWFFLLVVAACVAGMVAAVTVLRYMQERMPLGRVLAAAPGGSGAPAR